jgi:wyosine [tRNA(Phe)-imidazoG37] synthetase (radical SAM superfamily)
MKSREPGQLGVTNHDRDAVAKRTVYPVVSRRAGGVSVGVNLNPNNACNWRCQYCQVPNLIAGKGPPIDLEMLARELGEMLHDIVHGDFMVRRVPEHARELKDIAVSGNGEPTTSPHFSEAIEVIAEALDRFDLLGRIKVVVITNGSMVARPKIQEALRRLSAINGQVWFKLDAATAEGMVRINGTHGSVEQQLGRLRIAASLCDTWVQTCMFARDGQPPSDDELRAFLGCLRGLAGKPDAPLGVLLYTLARAPQQGGAERLSALSHEWLDDFGRRIEGTGIPVKVVD